MLGIKGAFIIVSEREAYPAILSATALQLHLDRCNVVGNAKANIQTFGVGTIYAFPAVAPCLETLMDHYAGPHAAQVKLLCARIVLRESVSRDRDDRPQSGGQGVVADSAKPKPKPSGGSAIQQKMAAVNARLAK